MLREIAGWVRHPTELWEVTMRRMKHRVENTLQKYPVMLRRRRFAKYVWEYVLRINISPSESWIAQSSMWVPSESEDPYREYVPYRCRGRPCLKWDSSVRTYCSFYFNASWQELSIDVLRNAMDSFIDFFCACDHNADVVDLV